MNRKYMYMTVLTLPSRNGHLNQVGGQSRSAFGAMAAFSAIAAFATGIAAAANGAIESLEWRSLQGRGVVACATRQFSHWFGHTSHYMKSSSWVAIT